MLRNLPGAELQGLTGHEIDGWEEEENAPVFKYGSNINSSCSTCGEQVEEDILDEVGDIVEDYKEILAANAFAVENSTERS